MSDRVTVALTILKTQESEAVRLLDEGEPNEFYEEGDLITLVYHEVHNGDLPNLGKLTDAGIAYDSCWDAGSSIWQGGDYARFLEDGSLSVKRIFDKEKDIQVNDLLKVIDDHEALKALILKKQKDNTILPFKGQEARGKLYQTRKLINAI